MPQPKCDRCDNDVFITNYEVAIEEAFEMERMGIRPRPVRQLCRECWEQGLTEKGRRGQITH